MSDKMNLLEETVEILSEHGFTASDVLWVSTGDGYYFTWDQFRDIANIEYDSGYGSEEINRELVVVGKNFWLERENYDGSEWWEFKTKPIKPKKSKKPRAVDLRSGFWRYSEGVNE